MLQAIRFDNEKGKLEVLDQLLLPHTVSYILVKTVEDGWNVINKMQARNFTILLAHKLTTQFLIF
jgi:methylthioribose-1-phosphate isomerase